MEWEKRVMKVAVLPVGADVFDENATTIAIDDEGGGEFVVINSNQERDGVAVDVAEWPFIRDAIDEMVKECK